MFKRNWLLLAAAFGIAIVGAILLIGKTQEPKCADILQELSAGSPPEESNNTNHSSSVTCERDCQVTFFRRHEADHEADAKEKRSNTYCDTAEELDLLAQKQMAHWTFYIALLTGAGVLLLIGTLAEAQRTNQAFTEASQRELRAYISYTKIRAENQFGKQASVQLTICNKGHTPAHKMDYLAHLSMVDENCNPLGDFVEKVSSSQISLGPGVSRVIELEGAFPLWYVGPYDPRQHDAHLAVTGKITYEDFAGAARETNFALISEKPLSHLRANRPMPMVFMYKGDNSAS